MIAFYSTVCSFFVLIALLVFFLCHDSKPKGKEKRKKNESPKSQLFLLLLLFFRLQPMFFFFPDCLFAQCSGNKVENHNEKLCFHEQEKESTISVTTTAAAVKRVLACYRKSALSVLFIVASEAVFFLFSPPTA